jgi:hypothetical protein
VRLRSFAYKAVKAFSGRDRPTIEGGAIGDRLREMDAAHAWLAVEVR